VTPSGLQLFILLQKRERGGGTDSISTTTLSCKDISFGDFGSFAHHAILFKCQPPVQAITLYRPQNHCPTFFTDFSQLLSIDLDNYDEIIVLGDFNFIQHVTGPTYNHGHSLDLVITKGLSIDISFIVDVALSDHHCVLFYYLVTHSTG
jgi:hypothetical protein